MLHHNPTHNGAIDTLESAWGILTGRSRAGQELGRFLAATRHIAINLVAHSQGGISTNIALKQVYIQFGGNTLPNLAVHYNGAAVNRRASENLVASLGSRFNGFDMNKGDPIPVLFGGNISSIGQVLNAIIRIPVTIRGAEHGSTHTHYDAAKF